MLDELTLRTRHAVQRRASVQDNHLVVVPRITIRESGDRIIRNSNLESADAVLPRVGAEFSPKDAGDFGKPARNDIEVHVVISH